MQKVTVQPVYVQKTRREISFFSCEQLSGFSEPGCHKYLPGLFGQLRTGINIIVATVSGKSNERLLKLYKRNPLAGLSNLSIAELLLQKGCIAEK